MFMGFIYLLYGSLLWMNMNHESYALTRPLVVRWFVTQSTKREPQEGHVSVNLAIINKL